MVIQKKNVTTEKNTTVQCLDNHENNYFEQPYIVLYENHLRDCSAIAIGHVLLLTTYLEEYEK